MPAKHPALPRVDAYLRHYAMTQPSTAAWIDEQRTLTFAQASGWVDDLARALIANGIQMGERVAVYGKPGIEFIALFLAITSVGAIYLGLNPKYTAIELATLIEDAEPSLLFNLLDDSSIERDKLTLASRRLDPSPRILGLSELVVFSSNGPQTSAQDLECVRQAVDPASVALLVYTSGSTGKPKGAQLTHRGLTFIAPISNDPLHFGVQGQGRTLCNLPINHVGCVVDLCTNSIIMGTTLVFQPDFDPDRMLEAIEVQGLTMVGGVPVMFLLMSRSPRFVSTDYSSLQRIVLAGNASPLPLVREVRRVMRATVINGYGLTEAMGFSTFTDLDADDETIANTVGRFDPRIDWRLADDHGSAVEQGQIGEIQMRGDWLFKGYFRRVQATAEAFTADGWFRTGDLATLLPTGNVRLTGRSKEMFKSGGFNVYPIEIETAIEACKGVAMAVVVAVPDKTYCEVGYAYVVLKDGGAPLNVLALRGELLSRLANYKVPKHFEAIAELPLLPIGKVDRLTLKQIATAAVEATPGVKPHHGGLTTQL